MRSFNPAKSLSMEIVKGCVLYGSGCFLRWLGGPFGLWSEIAVDSALKIEDARDKGVSSTVSE
jgi:hypothetical protein